MLSHRDETLGANFAKDLQPPDGSSWRYSDHAER